MKKVLKYILPLLCFVALIGSIDTAMNDKTIPEVMVTASDACISTDDAECIPVRPTSSVNSGQRVQKSSRQSNTSQRRSSAFLKTSAAVHPHLHGNTYFNLYSRPTAFVPTAHRLISFGRLVI